MFAHGGWSHIFFNMFALWMFGGIVERTWGPRKFLFYYMVCGIGAGLFQELAQLGEFYYIASNNLANFNISQTMLVAEANAPMLNSWTTVGASGAIYGILLAFGMLYPEERMFIFPLPVPIKAKWFVVGYAAIELFMAFSTANDGVAHIAHLGGMVFGFFLIRYWRRHPSIGYGRRGGQQFSIPCARHGNDVPTNTLTALIHQHASQTVLPTHAARVTGTIMHDVKPSKKR